MSAAGQPAGPVAHADQAVTSGAVLRGLLRHVETRAVISYHEMATVRPATK